MTLCHTILLSLISPVACTENGVFGPFFIQGRGRAWGGPFVLGIKIPVVPSAMFTSEKLQECRFPLQNPECNGTFNIDSVRLSLSSVMSLSRKHCGILVILSILRE